MLVMAARYTMVPKSNPFHTSVKISVKRNQRLSPRKKMGSMTNSPRKRLRRPPLGEKDIDEDAARKDPAQEVGQIDQRLGGAAEGYAADLVEPD